MAVSQIAPVSSIRRSRIAGLKRLMPGRISGIDLLALYVLLLFVLPDDVFRLTSLYTFSTPPDIAYKWNDFYFSALYLPIVFGGVFLFCTHRDAMGPNIFLFLGLLLLKDCVLLISGNDYVFSHVSFEQYMLYFVAACMVSVLFAAVERQGTYRYMLSAMFGITCITLLASIALHISPDQYDYVNRYTSTNMAHGETSLLIASFAMLIISDDRFKYKKSAVLICVILVISTGTRKDLVYMALLLMVWAAFSLCRRKRIIKDRRHNPGVVAVLFVMAAMATVILGVFPDVIISNLNIDRVSSLIGSITGSGTSLAEDYSIEGRGDSLAAGITVAKMNPILGQGFSFYAQQSVLQVNGFSTFPHFFWLFNWLVMGALVLVPIIQFLKSTLTLVLNRSKYSYFACYFVIYAIASGGEWSTFKITLYLFFAYWLVVKEAKRIRAENRLQQEGNNV